jgi:hypothetical protein
MEVKIYANALTDTRRFFILVLKRTRSGFELSLNEVSGKD